MPSKNTKSAKPGQGSTPIVQIDPGANATLKMGIPVTDGVLTHQALAEKLGVNRQVVTWHAKKADSPPLSDVEAWKTYLDGKASAIDGKMSKKIAAQRLRKLTAEANVAEREDKQKAGEFVEFPEVRKYALDVNSFFFGELDRLRQTMPSLLKGRTELEIFQVLDGEIPKIKLALQSRLQGVIGK